MRDQKAAEARKMVINELGWAGDGRMMVQSGRVVDAYPSSPSHRCDAPSAVRVQLVPGSPEVRGHTSSGTTAVVWGTPGMDPSHLGASG